MQRFYFFCILFFSSLEIFAQTFSLITDPVSGDETNFHNNLAVDMQISEDKIILSGQHSCFSTTGSENQYLCGSLSSFDFEGNFHNSILLDSFFNANQGGLLVKDEQIFTANFRTSGPSLGRRVYIQKFNNDLELLNQTTIPTRANLTPNNDGLKYIDGYFYVHGSIFDGGKSIGFIQKLDDNLNLIWDKLYSHERAVNGCLFLQKTNDEELIYLHRYSSEASGVANSGIQIVKLNTDGIKTDSLEIPRESNAFSLLSDSEGFIYVFTEDHPTVESIFNQSQGRINKYTNNLDTLLWSVSLPDKNGTRFFSVPSITEASNGDLLICGNVIENSDEAPIISDHHLTRNAFISRISKDGEIKWLHRYKVPNIHPLLPSNEFGFYRNSFLGNVSELEDGRIVASGRVSYTQRQREKFVVSAEEGFSEFLILVVDGETGCIEGEECDEVIILDGENIPKDDYLPVLNSNFTWHTERTNEDGSIEDESYTYAEEIFYSVDSLQTLVFCYIQKVVNPNSTAPIVDDFFREVAGRMYKKFPGSFNDKIVFDIHLKLGDSITVERESGPKDFVAIATDTVALDDGILRKRIMLQCLSEPISTDTIVWIEGIGELDNRGACNEDGKGSQILCVVEKSGNLVYSLNDDSCDNFTAVQDLKSTIDVKIYPNPVNDRLYIETTDQNWSYQVINLQGQQMLQGQYQDHIDVDQLPSGIYFLQMQKDDDLYQAIKFVKE